MPKHKRVSFSEQNLALDEVDLLRDEAAYMNKAAEHLRFALQRCAEIQGRDEYSAEQLERFESLVSRFARLSDLVIQKMFRLIGELDLEDPETIRDRINNAEKKGLIASSATFVEIRELRNSIAHDYSAASMQKIFDRVITYCPDLLDAVERIHRYIRRYD